MPLAATDVWTLETYIPESGQKTRSSSMAQRQEQEVTACIRMVKRSVAQAACTFTVELGGWLL